MVWTYQSAASLTSSLFTVDSSVGAIPVTFGSETIDNQAWTVGTAAASNNLTRGYGGNVGTITYSTFVHIASGHDVHGIDTGSIRHTDR